VRQNPKLVNVKTGLHLSTATSESFLDQNPELRARCEQFENDGVDLRHNLAVAATLLEWFLRTKELSPDMVTQTIRLIEHVARIAERVVNIEQKADAPTRAEFDHQARAFIATLHVFLPDRTTYMAAVDHWAEQMGMPPEEAASLRPSSNGSSDTDPGGQ
jgi:hypothetical protein